MWGQDVFEPMKYWLANQNGNTTVSVSFHHAEANEEAHQYWESCVGLLNAG